METLNFRPHLKDDCGQGLRWDLSRLGIKQRDVAEYLEKTFDRQISVNLISSILCDETVYFVRMAADHLIKQKIKEKMQLLKDKENRIIRKGDRVICTRSCSNISRGMMGKVIMLSSKKKQEKEIVVRFNNKKWPQTILESRVEKI